MASINENYLKLPGSYLFAEIARRVTAFKSENPSANIIRLGIGDVTQPLVPSVIKGLHTAIDEMAQPATFRGYGPEQGYDYRPCIPGIPGQQCHGRPYRHFK